ncbi:MAG: SbcC/MukB-like Walker B domain-containing protein [Thermoleophilia bacterium]
MERDAEDAGTLDRAAARLGAWAAHADPVAALEAAMLELRDAEEAHAHATRALSAADAAAAQAGAALHDLTVRELAVVRDALTRLITLAGLSMPPPAADAAALLAGCAGARDDAGALLADARDAARRADDAARDLAAGFARAAVATGVNDPSHVAAASGAAHRAREQARAHLAELEQAAGRAAALHAEARDAHAQAGVYATVVRDLQVNNFPRFLLARFRERLAAGASMRLQELTGGAFRFSGREPDPLAVVDLRRGERLRSAATLSGGERFMASLALALGLSDIAAESGGRLDCLFLDEGFSTLDAESLEQALAGVERLTGDGRLVAVITHLPGVADRLGSTIRVAKNAEGVSALVTAG